MLGIPDSISDDDLEETLTAILSDTDIQVIENDAQGCHRTRNSDKNNKPFCEQEALRKDFKIKKNWLPMTSPNINFQGTLKLSSMKI